MADKDVKIKISTTADTKGAKDASKEVDKLVASEKKLGNVSEQATNSIAGMKSEITRLTTELERAEIGSEDFIAKARQLDAAQSKLDTTLRTSGSGIKNVGMLIGQAGFQVQDFAVQVGGGTSALTAFAQQGSQLLGMFGPGGAVAGALLAVGAIGVRMFSELKEEAKVMETDIDAALKGMAANAEEELEKVIKEIDETAEAQARLIDKYKETEKSAGEFAEKELENAEKIRQAIVTINEVLGIQIDRRAELERQQQAAEDRRKLAEQQAIQAQNRRLSEAQQQLEVLAEQKDRYEQLRNDSKLELVAANAKLESLRQQRRELEALAKLDIEKPTSGPDPVLDPILARAAAARNEVQSPAYTQGRDLIEGNAAQNISKIEAEIAKFDAQIASLGTTISQSAARMEDVQGSVAIEIEKIASASRAEELVTAATNAKETIEEGDQQLLAGLNIILEASRPVTDSQKQARDKIASLISDLNVSAQDAAQIAGELPVLVGSISANNRQALDLFATILNLLKIQDQNYRSLSSQLSDLKSRMGTFRK